MKIRVRFSGSNCFFTRSNREPEFGFLGMCLVVSGSSFIFQNLGSVLDNIHAITGIVLS